MKQAHVSDVTQEEFDSAVQTVISGIKASNPKLDTRVGTVLRSLLVNPEAYLESVVSKQIEYVRTASSLKTLSDAESQGEQIDVEDVNAIMSNFNIKTTSGTHAEGLIKITVVNGTQTYTVAQGVEFSTIDKKKFVSVSTVVAASSQKQGVARTSELYKGAAGYFFLVPVKAVEVGADYNITQGTSVTTNIAIYTFVSAEAYKSFSGGSDITDLKSTIAQIPSGIAIRGFVNKNSCEGMLRDEFDKGDNPIIACSTVGYGNGAQRRDKHNIFGVGVGGRIDLYVRNFGDLTTITKTVLGHKITPQKTPGAASYELEITPEEFPGSCWIKDISTTQEVNSSLAFSCQRTSVGVDTTWHDFDVRKDTSETFNTIWQGFKVVVQEVPEDTEISEEDSPDAAWSTDRLFSVTVYCLPQAVELQQFVDREDIRSVSTDVVVRCPIICNVSVNASAVYDVANPVDVEDAKYKIRKYINSLGFVKALTRSEIVHILKECGVISVDLSKKNMLYGSLYDAFGKEHILTGDSLQVDGLAQDAAMLSSDTTIFAVEPENIQLILTPNE